MTETLIVVDDRRDWAPYAASEEVITAREYLFGAERPLPPGTRVVNLCRSYRYLSVGYYTSLLAEARRHRVIPSVRTINDLSSKAIYSLETEDLDTAVQRALRDHETGDDERLVFSIFFGETALPALADLARQIFDALTAPLLRVELRHRGQWRIAGVRAVPLNRLEPAEQDVFAAAIERYSRDVWRARRRRRPQRYDLAILHDPEEKLPPSNRRALERFGRVGQRLGINVELVTRRDYGRLGEYDALFIRETTSLSDHTYRFAKKAESEGMVVIDDPDSILRCTNKVYLSELLENNDIPRPAARILQRGAPVDADELDRALGFPLVLKIPDGSFSRGVERVATAAELAEATRRLFARSDLLLAQEFLTSEYDWRIGMLNGRPIFACQYFFARGHWQIYQHRPDGGVEEGDARTIAASDAPREVLRVATRAAGLIGNGLYGVDIKQSGRRVVVIEVNDNPNIDAGVEDAYLGEELYRLVLEEFVRRLERKRNPPGAA